MKKKHFILICIFTIMCAIVLLLIRGVYYYTLFSSLTFMREKVIRTCVNILFYLFLGIIPLGNLYAKKINEKKRILLCVLPIIVVIVMWIYIAMGEIVLVPIRSGRLEKPFLNLYHYTVTLSINNISLFLLLFLPLQIKYLRIRTYKQFFLLHAYSCFIFWGLITTNVSYKYPALYYIVFLGLLIFFLDQYKLESIIFVIANLIGGLAYFQILFLGYILRTFKNFKLHVFGNTIYSCLRNTDEIQYLTINDINTTNPVFIPLIIISIILSILLLWVLLQDSYKGILYKKTDQYHNLLIIVSAIWILELITSFTSFDSIALFPFAEGSFWFLPIGIVLSRYLRSSSNLQ